MRAPRVVDVYRVWRDALLTFSTEAVWNMYEALLGSHCHGSL